MINDAMVSQLWGRINNLRLVRGMKMITSDHVRDIANRFEQLVLPTGDVELRCIHRTVPGAAVLDARGFNDDGTISVIASDETVDRYGDIIDQKGWDLTNFKKNPMILVDHFYSVSAIVGQAKRMRIEKLSGNKSWILDACAYCEDDWCGFNHRDWASHIDKASKVARRLVLDVLLDSGEHNLVAADVRNKLEARSLRTTSVGFIPLVWEKILDDEDQWTGGFIFKTQELIEDSFVAVPANPNALVSLEADAATPGKQPADAGVVLEGHSVLLEADRILRLQAIARRFIRS